MLKTQRRLFSIAGSRTSPTKVDLHGWPLKSCHRFRIRSLILPPVDDASYPELDLCLVTVSGASGRSCLAPHVFRDANLGYCRKYTTAVPVAKGVSSTYTTTDYNWDVAEEESFSIETLSISLAVPGGQEIDFGTDRFVMLEIETD